MAEMANGAAGQAAIEARNPLQSLWVQRRELNSDSVRSQFDQVQQEIWQACGWQAIVFHPGMVSGSFIARQLGIPR